MLFQKDYWKMYNKELEKHALKYHIGAAVAGPDPYYDRNYAIKSLLARDQALRTGITVIATIVSILATVVNLSLVFFTHYSNIIGLTSNSG